MFSKILKSKTDLPHLLYLSVVACLITGVIVNQFWPILIMAICKIDVNVQKDLLSTPATILWLFSGLLFLGPFTLLKIRTHLKTGNLSKVKNYILVSIMILLLSAVLVYY